METGLEEIRLAQFQFALAFLANFDEIPSNLQSQYFFPSPTLSDLGNSFVTTLLQTIDSCPPSFFLAPRQHGEKEESLFHDTLYRKSVHSLLSFACTLSPSW